VAGYTRRWMGNQIRKGQQQGQQRVIVRELKSGLAVTFDDSIRNDLNAK
jgi:hypothetical protein